MLNKSFFLVILLTLSSPLLTSCGGGSSSNTPTASSDVSIEAGKSLTPENVSIVTTQ